MIQEAKQGKIRIQDTRFEIFNQVKAQPLFEAADEFDIEDLIEQCVSFLISHVQMNNVYQLISWAMLHWVDELLEAAVHFHNEKLIKLFPKLCWPETRSPWQCLS